MSEFTRELTKPAALAIGAVVTVGLVWLLFGDKIKAALAATADAVNPLSDTNLAYRSVNGIGKAVSGQDAWTFGGAIYDLFHEDANLASDAAARAKLAAKRAPDEGTWYENLFSKLGG